MPKEINPIKKDIVKRAIKEGKSFRRAVLEAGYAPSSANNATSLSSVKECIEEVKRELKASDVTVELVIKNLNEDRNLAQSKGDIATMTRVDELLGKYLALFTDKKVIDANVITKEEQDILSRYISNTNRLPT